MIFHCLFCIQYQDLFPLMVHAQREWLNLNNETPILVH